MNSSANIAPIFNPMSYILHRKYPHRGRGSFTFGRRHKSTIKTSQMLIDANDGEGVVYHTIPRKKLILSKSKITVGFISN